MALCIFSSGKPSQRETPTSQKILITVLILIIATLAVALVVLLSVKSSPTSESKRSKDGLSGACQSPYKQDTTMPKDPTVFQDLSPEEHHAVRDYMLKKSGLSLKEHAKATQDSNFIYLIELYLPNKANVLSYLDAKGKKPARRARVVITNGGKASPNVEEYLVEPLPNPTKHTQLKLAFRADSIPFASRPWTGFEEENLNLMIKNVSKTCYAVLKESFNFWYHNCSKNCLRCYFDGVPANFRTGHRKTWMIFLRDRPGYDVLPVPFEILFNHADKDAKKWKVEKVS